MSDPKPPTNPAEKLEELRQRLAAPPARPSESRHEDGTQPAHPPRGGAPRFVMPGGSARPSDYHRPAPRYAPPEEYLDYAEFERLQAEHAQLREFLDEIKPILEEAEKAEQRYTDLKEKATKKLQERDAQIQGLQERVADFERQVEAGELVPRPKTRSELEEWADELEQESTRINQLRRELEAERTQLRDDEESLEKQMRDMELQMARERALLARQETELKRLNGEIQRELELMQRGDTALRERMSMFQRRHQEVTTHAPASAGREPSGPSSPTPPPRDSGLLRRFFGRES